MRLTKIEIKESYFTDGIEIIDLLKLRLAIQDNIDWLKDNDELLSQLYRYSFAAYGLFDNPYSSVATDIRAIKGFKTDTSRLLSELILHNDVKRKKNFKFFITYYFSQSENQIRQIFKQFNEAVDLYQECYENRFDMLKKIARSDSPREGEVVFCSQRYANSDYTQSVEFIKINQTDSENVSFNIRGAHFGDWHVYTYNDRRTFEQMMENKNYLPFLKQHFPERFI